MSKEEKKKKEKRAECWGRESKDPILIQNGEFIRSITGRSKNSFSQIPEFLYNTGILCMEW